MATQKKLEIKIAYKINEKEYSVDLSEKHKCEHFEYDVTYQNNIFKMSVEPKCKIEFVSAYTSLAYNFQVEAKIFANGYQSWTDSREYSIYEKMHNINKLPRKFIEKYSFNSYGDYDFVKYTGKRGNFHSFTYGYVRNNNKFDFIGSLDESYGYTIIGYDVKTNNIKISKDCEGFIAYNKFDMFNIAFLDGDEDYVFDTYFELSEIEPPKHKSMFGYTSWYNHYQNINEEIILKNLDSMCSFSVKPDIFQIDDGYQTAVGDWLSINTEKFPNGMKPIADKIKEKGLISGIWLAPFVCEDKSIIFNEHNDWILKDKNGKLVRSGCNWGGHYALDIYNPEVRNYIKNCFNVILNEWGFEMVKLDFLYAVSIIPYNNKSRGQIMCEAMDFLRECVGDKLILGCGVPLGPAFGKVDFCRIGCDIGLDFDDKPHMRLLHRERISTKNAIYNTIYRRQLDKRAFLNDPDVFLLRDTNLKLSNTHKEILCKLNSLCASIMFTSDDISEYNQLKEELVLSALKQLDAKVTDVNEFKKGSFVINYTLNNLKKEFIFKL